MVLSMMLMEDFLAVNNDPGIATLRIEQVSEL